MTLFLLVIPLLMQPSINNFLCNNITLLTHIDLVVPQVPFHRAALQVGRAQTVLHSWIIFSQMQALTVVIVRQRPS